ncbi:MAG TPA: ATP-binding protein [Desulfosporosinus sp.]|nr:ATP-binding protein [Desulfosporosinus sp.]
MQIADNGKEMDEQSVNHRFDRYYRGTSTDVLTGGTGLGMAIVKQIVMAHPGTVDVNRKIEHGISIIVQLPIS